MTKRERASMADAALNPRSPLEGLALPTTPRFALAEAPPGARFILRGRAAARVLNARGPLDLDLKAFAVGFATRTLFDKVEIVLWRRADTTFHIEIWRSFAPYLAASLAEAACGAPQW